MRSERVGAPRMRLVPYASQAYIAERVSRRGASAPAAVLLARTSDSASGSAAAPIHHTGVMRCTPLSRLTDQSLAEWKAALMQGWSILMGMAETEMVSKVSRPYVWAICARMDVVQAAVPGTSSTMEAPCLLAAAGGDRPIASVLNASAAHETRCLLASAPRDRVVTFPSLG